MGRSAKDLLAPIVLQLAAAFASFPILAQLPSPPSTTPAAASAKAQRAVTKPDWSELTPAQQSALSPLASSWGGISEAQKRKWIALSQNYPTLSTTERTTLHGRMTDWAALSPAQRNQARLNFAQAKNLPAEQKKAQWEAYQALSPEKKKQLAAGAKTQAPGAAPAVTPIAPNKLAAVPVTRSDASNPARTGAGHRAGNSGAPRPKGNRAASAPVAQP